MRFENLVRYTVQLTKQRGGDYMRGYVNKRSIHLLIGVPPLAFKIFQFWKDCFVEEYKIHTTEFGKYSVLTRRGVQKLNKYWYAYTLCLDSHTITVTAEECETTTNMVNKTITQLIQAGWMARVKPHRYIINPALCYSGSCGCIDLTTDLYERMVAKDKDVMEVFDLLLFSDSSYIANHKASDDGAYYHRNTYYQHVIEIHDVAVPMDQDDSEFNECRDDELDPDDWYYDAEILEDTEVDDGQ